MGAAAGVRHRPQTWQGSAVVIDTENNAAHPMLRRLQAPAGVSWASSAAMMPSCGSSRRRCWWWWIPTAPAAWSPNELDALATGGGEAVDHHRRGSSYDRQDGPELPRTLRLLSV